MLSEVIGNLNVQGTVWVSESLKLDTKLIANQTSRPFCTDQIATMDGLALTVSIDDIGTHPINSVTIS